MKTEYFANTLSKVIRKPNKKHFRLLFKFGVKEILAVLVCWIDDIEAFKKASKPVYEAFKKDAGKLGAQLLDAASKL